MDKGIQIGNETPSKEILKMQFEVIMEILGSKECEEETKREALKTLSRLSTVQNVEISNNKIIEKF